MYAIKDGIQIHIVVVSCVHMHTHYTLSHTWRRMTESIVRVMEMNEWARKRQRQEWTERRKKKTQAKKSVSQSFSQLDGERIDLGRWWLAHVWKKKRARAIERASEWTHVNAYDFNFISTESIGFITIAFTSTNLFATHWKHIDCVTNRLYRHTCIAYRHALVM